MLVDSASCSTQWDQEIDNKHESGTSLSSGHLAWKKDNIVYYEHSPWQYIES